MFTTTTVTITFIWLATAILSFIHVVSNNYQYRRLLIVITKGYDFKGRTLSSFDCIDAIYQGGEDVVGREMPIIYYTILHSKMIPILSITDIIVHIYHT